MHRRKTQKAGGIVYLSETEVDENELAYNSTPKASRLLHPKSPEMRSSERIKRRQSREFTMPSRRVLLDAIPASITPSKSLADYKPARPVNNFMRETHRYNADRLSLSDRSSDEDADFINDDQEEEEEEEKNGESSEETQARPVIVYSSDSQVEQDSDNSTETSPSAAATRHRRSARAGDGENVSSRRRNKRVISRHSGRINSVESTRPSSPLADDQETPMNGTDDIRIISRNRRAKCRLFSSNDTSEEEDCKIETITSDEEDVEGVGNTARRRKSLGNRSVLTDDDSDDIDYNKANGDGINEKVCHLEADQCKIPSISPVVPFSTDDLLLPVSDGNTQSLSVESLFGTPATSSDSSNSSGSESGSDSSSSSDNADLQLLDRLGKRAKHMQRMKEPKRLALDALKQVREKKIHAISGVLLDEVV